MRVARSTIQVQLKAHQSNYFPERHSVAGYANMKSKIKRPAALILLLATFSSTVCYGNEGDEQAHFFTEIYSNLCLINLTNLDLTREKIIGAPKLPPEKAALFIGDHPGDAWPVTSNLGEFVLSLSNNNELCAVHAKRLNTVTAEKPFRIIVGTAPSPLVSIKLKDEIKQTQPNGEVRTISYDWSLPGATRTMLFTLSIAPSAAAQLQALVTTAILRR